MRLVVMYGGLFWTKFRMNVITKTVITETHVGNDPVFFVMTFLYIIG